MRGRDTVAEIGTERLVKEGVHATKQRWKKREEEANQEIDRLII